VGDRADRAALHGLNADETSQEYVSLPNTLLSHADKRRTGTDPDTALSSLYVRAPPSIYIACTLSHNNYIYLCMHNLAFSKCLECKGKHRDNAGKTAWLLDSGANCHFTYRRDDFVDYTELEQPETLHTANSTS
jgi:hypothetical protein